MHSNFVKRLLKAAWVLELVVAVLILAVTLLELFLLGEGTLSQVLALIPTPGTVPSSWRT